jgi:acyl-CoA thioesterase-1
MRSLLACLLLLSLSLSANTAQTMPERPPLLKGVHRIVCLGDSITQGGEGPGGYVWLLRHYLNALYGPHTSGGATSTQNSPDTVQTIEVVNAGISGHKSTDMLARFQRDVLDKKPDLVTISVGVNDVWHGFYDNHPEGDGPKAIPLVEYRQHVEDMITQAEKSGAKVVVLSTTVIHEEADNKENAKLKTYNAALRDLAKKHHATFVDYQKPFWALITAYQKETGGHELLLTVDGVHMNATGNRVMAHTLLTGLGISATDQATAQAAVEADQRGNKQP